MLNFSVHWKNKLSSQVAGCNICFTEKKSRMDDANCTSIELGKER